MKFVNVGRGVWTTVLHSVQ